MWKAKKWGCILCSVSHWLPMITRQPLEILDEKLTGQWKVITHSLPLHNKQYYSNVMHKENEVIKKSTDFKPLQKKNPATWSWQQDVKYMDGFEDQYRTSTYYN